MKIEITLDPLASMLYTVIDGDDGLRNKVSRFCNELIKERGGVHQFLNDQAGSSNLDEELVTAMSEVLRGQ